MIILPLFLLGILSFIFSSSVEEIIQYQTIMNCPFPVNSGIATFNLVQTPPQIDYTFIPDNDTDLYHVTTFQCELDPLSSGASLSTAVYTADVSNAWFDMTNRASGYMFYISEWIETLATRVNAFANMSWLYLVAPSVVTGLAWFAYVQVILGVLIALGIFLVVKP